jgi:hypothetical protein
MCRPIPDDNRTGNGRGYIADNSANIHDGSTSRIKSLGENMQRKNFITYAIDRINQKLQCKEFKNNKRNRKPGTHKLRYFK